MTTGIEKVLDVLGNKIEEIEMLRHCDKSALEDCRKALLSTSDALVDSKAEVVTLKKQVADLEGVVASYIAMLDAKK